MILSVLCQNCEQSDFRYIHFSGECSTLRALAGREVLLLFPHSNYSEYSLGQLIETYDRAYAFAADISGREPSPSEQHAEYLPLAVVPVTCGPGCGRLGAKGIEVTEAKFDRIYRVFEESGRHDHLFFYELGRNFWFYAEGDGEWEELHTGFAVFFRDLLIRELGIDVAPINGVPYGRYMEGKLGKWEAFRKETAGLSWGEVQVQKNRLFPHAPLFWSSLWWELYLNQGTKGVSSVLKVLGERPLPGKAEAWYGFLDGQGSN